MSKTKVLIVGRHTPDLGAEASNIEVVGSENVLFSLKKEDVLTQIEWLKTKAAKVSADAILLQNVPAVLAVALIELTKADKYTWMGDTGFGGVNPRWGVIISVPGKREADVEKTFAFSTFDDLNNTQPWKMAEEAVKFSNGRARTSIEDGVLKVVVDPVTPFVFSHIEWF